MNKKKKKSLKKNIKKVHFDGKINLGHILNFIAILIAFFSLRAQERDLRTKVEDLKEIVYRIDKEEMERIKVATKGLEKDIYLHNYTTESLNNLKKVIHNQYYESTLLSEQLIKIAFRSENLKEIEKETLQNFIKINNLNIKINQASENHYEKIKKYESDNEPIYDSLNLDKHKNDWKIHLEKFQIFANSENLKFDILTDSLSKEKNKIFNKILKQ